MIYENFSLKKCNSLGIDATAKLFVNIRTFRQLKQLIEKKYFVDNKFIILGSGTNILFTEDFDGIVVRNMLRGGFSIHNYADKIQIKSYSGCKFDMLIQKFIAEQNRNNEFVFGLENLAKIPGTVGSAVIQNIGAYGVEQKDFFECCKMINVQTGEFKDFCNIDCNFGYRNSIFKQQKNSYFITSVVYSIKKQFNLLPNLNYPDLRKEFENTKLEGITPQLIYDTVSRIRESKLPNIDKYPNAGSFFKNPIITKNEFNNLKSDYPNIVFYDYVNGVKISAAWLIEQCGLKGKRMGNVGIHENHSLILVNYSNATGKEVVAFADFIISEVKSKFGITIEPEVVYV